MEPSKRQQVAARVPKVVLELFYELAEQYGNKERTITAAMIGFVEMDPDLRGQLFLRAGESYFKGSEYEPPKDRPKKK